MEEKKYIVEVIDRKSGEVIKHFEYDNYSKAYHVEEGLLLKTNLKDFDVVLRKE